MRLLLKITSPHCTVVSRPSHDIPAFTDNFHGEDGLWVGRRLARLVLPLELGEGAEDKGEGGEEDDPEAAPRKHLYTKV